MCLRCCLPAAVRMGCQNGGPRTRKERNSQRKLPKIAVPSCDNVYSVLIRGPGWHARSRSLSRLLKQEWQHRACEPQTSTYRPVRRRRAETSCARLADLPTRRRAVATRPTFSWFLLEARGRRNIPHNIFPEEARSPYSLGLCHPRKYYSSDFCGFEHYAVGYSRRYLSNYACNLYTTFRISPTRLVLTVVDIIRQVGGGNVSIDLWSKSSGESWSRGPDLGYAARSVARTYPLDRGSRTTVGSWRYQLHPQTGPGEKRPCLVCALGTGKDHSHCSASYFGDRYEKPPE